MFLYVHIQHIQNEMGYKEDDVVTATTSRDRIVESLKRRIARGSRWHTIMMYTKYGRLVYEVSNLVSGQWEVETYHDDSNQRDPSQLRGYTEDQIIRAIKRLNKSIGASNTPYE